MSEIFLDDSSLDVLTGIKRGSTRAGVRFSKFELQAEFLRDRGIPFIPNARGKPVVLRSALEGRPDGRATPSKGWSPAVMGA